MTSEPEAEISDVASAMAAPTSASESGDAGTLLEVTFQRNPSQKYKYLEAEPKILGMTEIAVAVFFIGCRFLFYIAPPRRVEQITNNIMVALSFVGIIAGSVAIAAQKLHLPTIKACLGMQVVTCVAYIFCLLFTINEKYYINPCWHYYKDSDMEETCLLLEEVFGHITSLDQLMAVTQIVLSVTLAAYCFKVIPCCTATHVPVIVMTPPTAPQ